MAEGLPVSVDPIKTNVGLATCVAKLELLSRYSFG